MERYSSEFDTHGVGQQLARDSTLGDRDLRQQLSSRRSRSRHNRRLGCLQSTHDLGHMRDRNRRWRGASHQELQSVHHDRSLLGVRLHLALHRARHHIAQRGHALGGRHHVFGLSHSRCQLLHG